MLYIGDFEYIKLGLNDVPIASSHLSSFCFLSNDWRVEQLETVEGVYNVHIFTIHSHVFKG